MIDNELAKWEVESNLRDKLEEFMENNEDEHSQDGRIKPERRLHSRPDINAFILLARLVPGERIDRDMVSAAEHDQIFLDVEPHELMRAATEEDLLDLMRCGVFYDTGFDSLSMFV